MAYTTIDNPELYFQNKIWNGNSSIQYFTLEGDEKKQPDFVWGKQRSGTQNHQLCDVVRGANKILMSNNGDNELGDSDILNSFDSNGFTLGYQDQLNDTGATYVAWCWKAGGSGSSNSEGDITATVSASTTAGFSLIKFQGNGSTSQSVGHGLNGTPAFWMIKNLTDDDTDFTMYWKGTDRIKLNTQEVMEQNYLMSASSTTITTPSEAGATWGNTASKDYMVWVWQELQGFSKFGKYVGNGNADGPFVYTGFRPAMVIVKNFSAGSTDWIITDNKRGAFNPAGERLYPNLNNAEDASGDYFNYLSNGFKFNENVNLWNTSGATYFYMAFAEAPFVNSKGVPNNAR